MCSVQCARYIVILQYICIKNWTKPIGFTITNTIIHTIRCVNQVAIYRLTIKNSTYKIENRIHWNLTIIGNAKLQERLHSASLLKWEKKHNHSPKLSVKLNIQISWKRPLQKCLNFSNKPDATYRNCAFDSYIYLKMVSIRPFNLLIMIMIIAALLSFNRQYSMNIAMRM